MIQPDNIFLFFAHFLREIGLNDIYKLKTLGVTTAMSQICTSFVA